MIIAVEGGDQAGKKDANYDAGQSPEITKN